MAFVAVEIDGTENIFKSKPFKEDIYSKICKIQGIEYPNPDKFIGKWYDTFTDGYYQVPKNNGVQLPLGSIEKLIGRPLTWNDTPIKL